MFDIIEARGQTKKSSLSPLKVTKEDTMSLSYCKHEGCNNPKNAGRGYCKTHYMRFWRGQDMDKPSPKDPRPAIIEGDIAKIPLGVNAKYGYTIVDKYFAHLAKSKWTLGKRGYVVTKNGATLHHAIIGKPNKGMVVDHINRDKLDNRKENLRFVSYYENAQNISKQKNNTSGYRGVWYRKDTGKWSADIKVNYKKISLGCFEKIEDAAIAYNMAAKRYFGKNAVLNEVTK